MTDSERRDQIKAEREIKRLAAHVTALERRLQAAVGAARGAISSRDIAVRLAA